MTNHKSQGATITTKVIINIKKTFKCKQGKVYNSLLGVKKITSNHKKVLMY